MREREREIEIEIVGNRIDRSREMSCNGCRVLRKGCSESCILRPCLQWIDSAQAQANATLFVAKFFGRAGLLSFISSVPFHQRPALFKSLLHEACGRTVNPVNGAVGLLWTGNWHLCEKAVDTVLGGGVLSPLTDVPSLDFEGASEVGKAGTDATPVPCDLSLSLTPALSAQKRRALSPSMESEGSVTTNFRSGGGGGSRICLSDAII